MIVRVYFPFFQSDLICEITVLRAMYLALPFSMNVVMQPSKKCIYICAFVSIFVYAYATIIEKLISKIMIEIYLQSEEYTLYQFLVLIPCIKTVIISFGVTDMLFRNCMT